MNWEGHPFWNTKQLQDLKAYLKGMGLLGSHQIIAEGYNDESVSYSEGTISDTDPRAEEMPYYWVETLEEMVSQSPQGFDYPLSRATESNAKQGYKNAINEKKAGEWFVGAVIEMLEEALYEYHASLDWTYRLNPSAVTMNVQGGMESERDHNDNDITIGSMTWEIDIDPMGIYKEMDE
jgi:hypothetical protein